MRSWILLFALMLAVGVSNAYTVTLAQTNCSQLKVTTDAGAGVWVTLEANGPYGWLPASDERATLTEGWAFFSAEMNGSHRAKARLSRTSNTYTYSSAVEVATCAPARTCTTKANCASGEICSGGICQTGECAGNADCPPSKACMPDFKCENVPCPCGQVANHVCTPYQCCADSDCGADEVCTSHTCRSKTLPPDPAAEEATTAISEAQAAVTAASAAGKDVAAAQILLSSANEKYTAKDYASAKTLASSAKSVALALMGGGTGNNGSGASNVLNETGGSSFSIGSPICILGIFITLGFVIAGVFLLIIGVVLYRERRKRH